MLTIYAHGSKSMTHVPFQAAIADANSMVSRNWAGQGCKVRYVKSFHNLYSREYINAECSWMKFIFMQTASQVSKVINPVCKAKASRQTQGGGWSSWHPYRIGHGCPRSLHQTPGTSWMDQTNHQQRQRKSGWLGMSSRGYTRVDTEGARLWIAGRVLRRYFRTMRRWIWLFQFLFYVIDSRVACLKHTRGFGERGSWFAVCSVLLVRYCC